MKYFYLTFLFLFINYNGFAQYTLSTSTNSYVSLVNPISINQGNVWDHTTTYRIDFNFNFDIYGEYYNALTVNAGGGLDFIGTTTKTLNVFFPVVPTFPAYQLIDRGNGASQSPISYEITGVPGNNILKIQWENAGFRQNSSDFVNYQIWLFEIDSHLEIRFGSRQFDTATFEQFNDETLGIRWIFDSCSNYWGVVGQANAPTYWIYDACSPNYTFIYGTPDSGMTYSINRSIETNTENFETLDLNLFPNPAKTTLCISGIEENIIVKEITIFDTVGKVLLSTNVSSEVSDQICLPIGNFNSGVYFLKLRTEDGRSFVRKVLKQND
ncbi:MAG: hypothetical protein Sapg2KO_29790 [Saprospiraceae bacterium]